MLKLKLQYFGHLMRRNNSLGKTLMLGKTKGRGRRGHRGWENWMASPTQWTCVWANSGRWWRTGKPGMLQSMGSQSRTGLRDWTPTTYLDNSVFIDPTIQVSHTDFMIPSCTSLGWTIKEPSPPSRNYIQIWSKYWTIWVSTEYHAASYSSDS